MDYLSRSVIMLLFFFNLFGCLFLNWRGFLLICLGVGYASFELRKVSLLAFVHLKLYGLDTLSQHT